MKSTFLNMVLVLLGISLVASLAVGGVNLLTRDTIAQANEQATVGSLAVVLPPFNNVPLNDQQTVEVDGIDLTIYTAQQDGETVGFAVQTMANGFSDAIKLMVGFDTDGTILNIAVLSQSETPGLGAKIKEDNNPVRLSFVGKDASTLKMTVRKDGGDIDAITASTISSRAYSLAVQRAYSGLVKLGLLEGAAVTENVKVTLLEPVVFKSDTIGYVVEVETVGYNAQQPITLRISFDADDTIRDIAVVAQSEDRPTAFDKIRAQLIGKRVSDLQMKPRSEGGDIDTNTGATITSRAYIVAVQRAWKAVENDKNGEL